MRVVATPAPTVEGPLHSVRAARGEEAELEVHWNGAIGRAGTSLTEGRGMGSSLAPGVGARVAL